jgi:hypothetical protein
MTNAGCACRVILMTLSNSAMLFARGSIELQYMERLKWRIVGQSQFSALFGLEA